MAKFGRKIGTQKNWDTKSVFFLYKKYLFFFFGGYIQILPSLQDYKCFLKNEVGKMEDHYAKSQQLKQDELFNFPFSYEDTFPNKSQKLSEIF